MLLAPINTPVQILNNDPVYHNVHGWMSGWIIAVAHPYYAVNDAEGRSTLEDIPPGTYKVECWQKLLGEQSA